MRAVLCVPGNHDSDKEMYPRDGLLISTEYLRAESLSSLNTYMEVCSLKRIDFNTFKRP